MAVTSKTKWFVVEMLAVFILACSFCAAVLWYVHFIPFKTDKTFWHSSGINRARADVKSLDQAVQEYLLKHKYFPDSLQELTQKGRDGSPALLGNTSILRDPWNNPYIYDSSLRPEDRKPLIYSYGPPGLNMHISNWD